MGLLRRWSWGRLDDQKFCRRLTLEGWEQLADAENRDSGLVLTTSEDGLWPIVVAAVGLYRGPLDLVATPSQLRELPSSWKRRFVRQVLSPEASAASVARILQGGDRALILSSSTVNDQEVLEARLEETSYAVFSIRADSLEGRRFRLVVRS